MAQILFENNDLVIVNKSSGVLSVPGRDSKDLRQVLGRELEKQLQTTIFPVHRLDFEVSGLIIYAKNASSHQLLNTWFENKKIKKTYRALTSGPKFDHFPSEEMFDRSCEKLILNHQFQWSAKLHKGKKRVFASPHGKEAITLAKVLSSNTQIQTWELLPVTGRSHQLRWELSRHGYPILGDHLYGSNVSLALNTLALRAVTLDFSEIQNQKNNLGLPVKFSLSEDLISLKDLI